MSNVTTKMLKDMLINAHNLFSQKVEYINELNVFPIPDKDTGTNMFLTLSNGINEIKNKDFACCKNLLKVFSKGLLIGARGNSGVIFSQIFYGFSAYFQKEYKKDSDVTEITVHDIKAALTSARKYAFKSVLKPIEGTILTTIHNVSQEVQPKKIKTISQLFAQINKSAKHASESTPKFLEVLRQKNVIDAGAAGLYLCFKAFDDSLNHHIHEFNNSNNIGNTNNNLIDHSEIVFNKDSKEMGYCTEGILYLLEAKIDRNTVIKELQAQHCDSIVFIHEDNILKFHLHTLTPWKVLDYLSSFGPFYKLKIENMTFQVESHEIIPDSQVDTNKSLNGPKQAPKDKAFIVLGNGDGIYSILEDFKVDYILTKEDNINQSVNDFIDTFKHVNAKEIFLFVNDKNALLTAKNAKQLYRNSKIHIIETANIFECYSCLIYLDKSLATEKILNTCNETLKFLKSAILCKSSKKAQKTTKKGNELIINKDDYVGLLSGDIIASNCEIIPAISQILAEITNGQKIEVITCFFGLDLSLDDEKNIEKFLRESTNYEFEFLKLNQPTYHLIMGVEYKHE